LSDSIDPTAPPNDTGCSDCNGANPQGWWFHLRRCAQCGHIGCCDSSPSQHARLHAQEAGHPVIQSFEPGESWFYDFETDEILHGPALAPPTSHPGDQPAPGPAGRVPASWMSLLNE
jgi:hypothetical protein